MNGYYCANCRASVSVTGKGDITRSCKCHDTTTVIAERSSILYGIGGAANLTLAERARRAIAKLLASLKGQ